MLPLSQTGELERLVGSLSGELALMEVGKDEGLVPGYTLLGELIELLGPDPRAAARCRGVQDQFSKLLDTGGALDAGAISGFALLVEQVQCFLRYYRMGETINWETLESQWDYSEDPVPEAAVPSGTPSGETLPEPPVTAQQADPHNTLLRLDLEESREVLVEFHQEALEHLDSIEAALLELEGDPENRDAISSVFRSFHTIKGVAGFLDLTPIRVLAHEVETLLDKVRSGHQELDERVVNLILESRDRLQLFMNQVHEGLDNGNQPETVIPVSDLIERTHAIMDTGETESPGQMESVPESGSGESFDFDASSSASLDEDRAADGGQGPAADALRKRTPTGSKASAASIRMNTEKLDSIIDAVGELVIVESQLRDSILSLGSISSRIERNLSQLGRITSDLQRSGLSLRMVSLKQLFQKMQRLARDLSIKSGKKVAFRVEGEDTEMDRTVVERIGDPLVHMIRNSMDHGIEGPEERTRLGKAPMGEVVLRAFYQGDNIVLELTDDGRGIDNEKVLKKAMERGLAQPGRTYSSEDIINFLFLPGFSTAAKVSDISGRGVGMDVVRSNVQKLRGRIEMTSVAGQGSRVRISLPLTMAIIDGLLIRVGEERYILPVMNVNMTLKPKENQIFQVQGRGTVINHRDQIVPLVHLGDFFGVPADASRAAEGVVVMIEADRQTYGLIVDEILHKQEVVVKHLGGNNLHPPGVSGGAILGDGTISLILDPSGLNGRQRQADGSSAA